MAENAQGMSNGTLAGGGTDGSVGGEGEIRLLMRMDDMGSAHGINEACVHAYRAGVGRSVEVMVPGGWFMEAASLLAVHPGLDVGVHLTLTCEWEGCKWRPLTHCPSLVDANGYFYPQTDQREDFPPGTSFRDCGYKVVEVEAEVRAQIKLAKKHIRQVTHISSHMGTATCTPELEELVGRIAKEEGLLVEGIPGMQYFEAFTGIQTDADRPAKLAENLRKLTPGFWYFVEHPGLDTPELRGLQHVNYYGVGVSRQSVTDAYTDPAVLRVIAERGIKLVSYRDFVGK